MAASYYIDQKENKRGEHALRFAVSLNGCRLLTTTGVNVYAKAWSADSQRARARRADDAVNAKGQTAAKVNAELAAISAFWAKVEAEKIHSAEDLRELWAKYRGRTSRRPKEDAALDFLAQYAKSEGRCWSAGSQTKWASFIELVKSSRAFSSLDSLADPEAAAAFVTFLREDRHQKDTTAAKYFSMLLRAVRYGERVKAFESMTAENLKAGERFKTIAQPVVYLEKDELLRFMAFDCSTVSGRSFTIDGERTQLNASTLEKVRTLFCFCAVTSLRLSDGLALRWGDIAADHIDVTTKKTADRLRIDLSERALDILARRRAELGGNPAKIDRVFDQLNTATMNNYLKALGFLCGVDSPVSKTFWREGRRVTETRPKYALLSSHAARRTFIVSALSIGIAPAVVMKFTGHSNYSAMTPYIDITSTAQAQAISKLNSLLK